MTGTDITPTVLVTGPTGGLGRDLVTALGRRRCRLVLVGRDPDRLAAVAAEARRLGAVDAVAVTAELASLASVRAAADRLGALGRPIDVVVANAGIQSADRQRTTADGIELTFGVNVVANHLLLASIDGALAPSAHVVLVGSGTHFGSAFSRLFVAAPRWEAPEALATAGGPDASTATAGQRAYSTSKLAVNHLCHEWNRRHAAPRRANVYDPGLMPGTGLARDLPPWKRWAWHRAMPALRVLPGVTSTAHSAERLARLALGEEHGGARGAYVEIGRLTRASAESYDETRERELWAWCAARTAGIGAAPLG